MSNIQTRFNFVGEMLIPKTDSKRPFFKEMVGGKSGKLQMASLNLGIKESDNNMAFVESFGSLLDPIQTMDIDNNKIEIKYSDRFDEEIIKNVANYKKFIIDLGEDFGGRQEFISQYDAILYMKEYLLQYKGKVAVTGQMVKEWSAKHNSYFDKFKIQNIYSVSSDTKSRLGIVADIFYNKDSIDKADFKTEKKIYINGYINQYINKEEGNKYIPQQFVFNASKFKEDNERHQELLKYKLSYIDIGNKNMAHIPWEIILVRGAESVDFDETMLTPKQKEQLMLGVRTLDDFKPKGNILGDKINEYRLFDPKLTNDFSDGLIDTEMKNSEFDELIYNPPKEEKMSEVIEKANNKSKDVKKENKEENNINIEVDDEDLF